MGRDCRSRLIVSVPYGVFVFLNRDGYQAGRTQAVSVPYGVFVFLNGT